MSGYARDDRYIAAWVEVHDPFRWPRAVWLSAVPAVLATMTAPPARLVETGARARLEAQELDIDAFLRELDAWADAENHQPSVLPP